MISLQRVAAALLLLSCGVAVDGLADSKGGDGEMALSASPAAREDARPPDVESAAREDARPPDVESAARLQVPLDALTNRFGVVSVAEDAGVTTWETPDAVLRFFDGSRRLEFNGTLLWMNGATATGAVTHAVGHASETNAVETVPPRTISQADVETVLVPLLTPAVPSDRSHPSDPFVVILDPGHGGDDPGAVVADMPPEKALVLDVAKRVRRRLTAAGMEVRMTRGGDNTMTLAERPDFARRRKGSIFVSIHANKAPNAAARGIETFVLPAAGFPSTADTVPVAESHPGNRHDAASLQLAYLIQRELIDQTQAVDRGVKRARFEVLRDAPCPAALVEIGFLSNALERERLADPHYADRIADGIASGIRVFMLQNTPRL